MDRFRSMILTIPLALSLAAIPAWSQEKARDTTGKTADQQKENRSDRETTRLIRRAIVKDDSLSSMAHNVKVITRNGMVTLRGPVRSEEEKKAVEAKAVEVAGAMKVTNDLQVSADMKQDAETADRARKADKKTGADKHQ